MKKKLSSTDHKIKRDSVNFQRGNTPEQRGKTAKISDSGKVDVKDALLLKEKQDKLLSDILHILYRGGYGKHNTMTMEAYMGDYMSILFGYQDQKDAQEKYEKILHFFEEEFPDKTITEKKNGGFSLEIRPGHMSIDVDYDKDHDATSINLSGSFTENAIQKAKKEYPWFDRSRSAYEKKEDKENEEFLENFETDTHIFE